MFRLTRRCVAIFALVATGACADHVRSPLAPPTSVAASSYPGELGDYVKVCKTSPIVGPYDFTASVSGGTRGVTYTMPQGNAFQVSVYAPNPEPPDCKTVYQALGTGTQFEPVAEVTVSEVNIPAGQQLDSIVIMNSALQRLSAVVGTATVTVATDFHNGKVLLFYNSEADEPPPPPPPSYQGCTPGYWKQPQHFGNWIGYTQSDRFNTVFARPVFTDNRTLLQALNAGGGGLNRLGRHATAALLNAANGGVAFGMTPTQVIAAVQAAFDNGTTDALASQFEKLNERGCPLGVSY